METKVTVTLRNETKESIIRVCPGYDQTRGREDILYITEK